MTPTNAHSVCSNCRLILNNSDGRNSVLIITSINIIVEGGYLGSVTCYIFIVKKGIKFYGFCIKQKQTSIKSLS